MPDLSFSAREAPAILAAAVFATLVVAALEARAGGGAGRRLARGLVRALVLLLVAAALARPHLARTQTAPARLVVLVDRAAAALDGGAAARDDLLARARAAVDAAGATLHVLPFDAAPLPTTDASPAPEPPAGARSRLAPALAASGLLVGAQEAGAVVVASDGRADGRDAPEAVAALAARGIPVRPVAIPPPGPPPVPEVGIRALEVPDLVTGPFALQAELANAPPGSTARLLVDGAPVPAGAPTSVGVDGAVAFDGLVLPPGLHDLAVVVDPPPDAGPATRPSAVLRHALVRVARPPRVLVIAGGPTGALLRRTLSSQGFEALLTTAADAGEALAAGEGADLVVLDADAVSPEAPKAPLLGALLARVRAGKGLLVAAGASPESWAALAIGPLGAALPVVPEEPPRAPIPPAPPPPEEPERPAPPEPDDPAEPGPGLVAEVRPEAALPISLLLVIDRSGSMQIEGKLGMAVRAAEEAATTLAPSDRVGVISFATDVRIDTPMTSVGIAAAMGVVPVLEAGGDTDIYAALALAGRVLGAETAPIRHILLLTDGIQSGSAYFTDLVQEIAARGITVSTVGLGQSINEYVLKAIARNGGGRFFFAPSPQDLPRVMTRDTRTVVEQRVAAATKARLSDPNRKTPARPKAPKPPKATPPPPPPAAPPPPPPPPPPPVPTGVSFEPLVRRRPHEAVAGLDPAAFPRIGPPRPTGVPNPATVVLERADGAAVLAVGRFGLGRIVVLALPASDPGFVGWADATPLVAQAARAVAPTTEDEPVAVVRVVAGPDGDRLRVAVPEGADPSAIASRLRVRRRGADGDVDAPLAASETGEVEFRLPGGAGPLAAVVVEALPDDGSEPRALPPIPYVPSAAAAPPVGSEPAALRNALGLDAPTEPIPGGATGLFEVPPRSRTHETPLAAWLAALAAVLLPFDAILHRRGKPPR